MLTKNRTELEAELIARVADDDAFRASLLRNPREVIQEAIGVTIPEDFTIQVHEENSMTAHIVLPSSGRLTEADLELVAGGNGLISGWIRA